MTPQEAQLLSTLGMNFGTGQTPQMAQAGSFLSNVLNPNFPQSIVNSPTTQAAISAAVNPLVSTFQNVTMPNLIGNAVANGQVLNGPRTTDPNSSGAGSSAFDKAAALAGTGLDQAVASATAPIANNAMLAGLNMQENAPSQATQLGSAQVQSLIANLQAQALPRLIQQYGMDQGVQQFNNRVQTMLAALGLGASVSGPDVANQTQSNSQFSSAPSGGLMGSLFGSGGSGLIPAVRGLFGGGAAAAGGAAGDGAATALEAVPALFA